VPFYGITPAEGDSTGGKAVVPKSRASKPAERPPRSSATTHMGLSSDFGILPLPRAGDSSRNLRSRCRFAVHRPGIPEASPRSHGMPCRGLKLRARLDIANNWKVPHCTDIPEQRERRFLPGLKAGVSMPRI
jgi:hypothetical protein